MTRLARQARNQPWDLRAGGILKDARQMGEAPAKPFPFILPVSGREYLELGRLIVYCGHLEFMLVRRLCRDKTDAEKKAIERRQINDKLDALEVCAADAEKEPQREYHSALGAMRELFPLRNDLVHGAWMADFESHAAVAVNPRKPDDALAVVQLARATRLASDAMNHLLKAMLIESGMADFPLPAPFFHQPPKPS